MTRRKLILPLLIVASFCAWRWAVSPVHLTDAIPRSQLSTTPTEMGETETEEQRRRRLIVGTWQDDYQGKRTMTLNADGTGTMNVELSGAKATLFAAELHFEMIWSLDGDKLKKTTTGGKPEKKVNLVLKMMGDTAIDTIVEISDDRLLLLDKDGETKYDWRRVEADQ